MSEPGASLVPNASEKQKKKKLVLRIVSTPEVKKKEQNIIKTEQNLESLKSSISSLKREKEKLEHIISIKKHEISAIETRQKRRVDRASKALKHTDDAKEEYNSAFSEHLNLTKEITSMKAKLSNIYSEIQIVNADYVSPFLQIQEEFHTTALAIQNLKRSIAERKEVYSNVKTILENQNNENSSLYNNETKLLSLRQSLCDKNNDLIQRENKFKTILSIPIDDLTFEEKLASDAENEVFTAEKRILQLNLDTKEQSYEQLEIQNAHRRSQLRQRSDQLHDQKLLLLSTDEHNFDPHPKLPSSPKVPKGDMTQSARAKLNQISSILEEKSKRANEAKAAADAYEKKVETEKDKMSKELEAQFEQIEQLRKTLSQISSLSEQGQDFGNKIAELTKISRSLDRRIEEIKHRIDNLNKSKENGSRMKSELGTLLRSIQKKKAIIETQESRLEELRDSVEFARSEVDAAESKEKELSARLAKAEAEVASAGKKVEIAVRKAKEEQAKMERIAGDAESYRIDQGKDLIDLINGSITS